MTTPAPATTTTAPTDAEMLAATFRALGCLIPGAVKGDPAHWEADTLAQLRHYGADDGDLEVISTWLAARTEKTP